MLEKNCEINRLKIENTELKLTIADLKYQIQFVLPI